jgi:hypothetical protein
MMTLEPMVSWRFDLRAVALVVRRQIGLAQL